SFAPAPPHVHAPTTAVRCPTMTITIDLSGKVALVTGGARGVGRGITRRLVDAGAEVVVCGRSEPDAGSLPNGVSFVAADVRDPASVDDLVDQIVGAQG